MKSVVPFLLTFLLAAGAGAEAPRLVARTQDGQLRPLPLARVAVSARFLTDVAETELDVEFRNPGSSVIEAEFILPLPEGAVVTGWALEVDGALRNAVAVEKDRARTAYESVRDRRIDPGIVEREAGNVHRIRVYPVPANGTKSCRIRYSETLPVVPGGFAYTLPLDFPAPPEEFTCRLSSPQPPDLSATPELVFEAGRSGDLVVKVTGGKLPAALKLTLPPLRGPALHVDRKTGAFFLSVPAPEDPPRPRPVPAAVNLVWDASLAGLGRDPQAAFALLDKWFASLGDTAVTLHLWRERLTDGGSFAVRGGEWRELRKALEGIDYDGAADLGVLKPPAAEDAVTVVVSHGPAALGGVLPASEGPLFAIATGSADQVLVRAASSSDGAAIDLSRDSPAAGLEMLRVCPAQLVSLAETRGSSEVVNGGWSGWATTGCPKSVLPWSQPAAGRPYHLFGCLDTPLPNQLKLGVGFGSRTIRDIRVAPEAADPPAGMIARLVAREELLQMERECPAPASRIIAHCKKHRLASGLTSLIVLERMADYVTYRIPPPTAELLAIYQQMVDQRPPLQRLGDAWAAKVAWFKREYPGVEQALLDRLRQVEIWKKAVESQFQPPQRDGAAFAAIAGWYEETKGLLRQKPGLQTKAEFATWQRQVLDLTGKGARLADTPLTQPPAGQPLAVSVRGMVARPGVVAAKPGLTLREAIELAGGPTPVGSLDAVALYRNAGKTVYNTLSRYYRDPPLFPGDMIVVMSPYSDPYPAEMDPFAEAGPRPPARLQAIRERQDVWVSEQRDSDGPWSERADPFADAGGSPSQTVPAAPGESAVRVGPLAEGPADTAAFAAALKAGQDPAAACRALTHGRRLAPSAYLEGARLLFEHRQPDLGRRMLSNLVAIRPREHGALLTYALWLAEFGQTAEAADRLAALADSDPAWLAPRLALASVRAAAKQPAAVATALRPLPGLLSGEMDRTLALIAFTEWNALPPADRKPTEFPQGWSFGSVGRTLPSDVRIVVTASEDEPLACAVLEPTGSTARNGALPTVCGGRLEAASGVAEYMIRQAIPGRYRLTCRAAEPVTLRIAIHTHWGRPNQQTRILTRWLEPGDDAITAEFEFVPER